MKKNQPAFVAGVLALILALSITVRMNCVSGQFHETVRESHKTSEGYDKKFIDMVNRLEEVLATRARFGFLGGKDPMTGRVRHVAKHLPVRKPVKVTKKASKPVDTFRLAAIYFDHETRRYSATVMDGERSFSVDVGDMVSGRKVVKITQRSIIMASSTYYYQYDIDGGSKSRRR